MIDRVYEGCMGYMSEYECEGCRGVRDDVWGELERYMG